MIIDIQELQGKICSILCADVELVPVSSELLMVKTPFYHSDGDQYEIYLKELPSGALRMTDCGHTLMHLSYENDIDKLREGTRAKVFQNILSQMDVQENDGELFCELPVSELGASLFRFGQALTQVNDLTFLNKVRVENTFYDDLHESILKSVREEHITREYIYPDMENASDYPIDFRIEGKGLPLFLFGIPNKDKAKLSTIVLERLLRQGAEFESLLVFSDQSILPRSDLARITNVGGEMVASLDAQDDLHRKLIKRAAN